ncbi:unnamed protein product [Blumeria hordei]|uniref:Uncharacterized protein n=1 Tax=Blumeria hordei TaxID=2867405 RepID=A0A383UYE6_BLUHO|nr:unnamed protein product [Blumeria hordei]
MRIARSHPLPVIMNSGSRKSAEKRRKKRTIEIKMTEPEPSENEAQGRFETPSKATT